MIEWIEFTNFKALRKTTLRLSPFTLLLGPNGSGKSTVLQALRGIADHFAGNTTFDWPAIRSVSANGGNIRVKLRFCVRIDGQSRIEEIEELDSETQPARRAIILPGDEKAPDFKSWLGRIRFFSFVADTIAEPALVVPNPVIGPNGQGFAAVADELHGKHPERWASLIRELCHWLPEYDNILFSSTQNHMKAIALRTKHGGHQIPAKELSQGTLVALALLTLAYLPEPPSVVGLEEIDRGLHPRLLRHLQSALYRLSYPESCGEKRAPIQVIATTHSPYLLDLYRDHPEEVVLAQKKNLEVELNRLSEIEHYEEIVGESALSEVWYSGVLGGVAVKP